MDEHSHKATRSLRADNTTFPEGRPFDLFSKQHVPIYDLPSPMYYTNSVTDASCQSVINMTTWYEKECLGNTIVVALRE